MTLVVVAANPTRIVVTADRKLSGKPTEADATKFILLACRDGRAVITYTGVAEFTRGPDRRTTIKWLFDVLAAHSSASPTLDELADEVFASTNATLRGVDEPTLIVMAGYHYEAKADGVAYRYVLRTATNVEEGRMTADGAFVSENLAPHRPYDAYTMPLGRVRPVDHERLHSLEEANRVIAPARSIESRSIGLIIEAAKHPLANGRIGTDVSSICIPSRPGPIEMGYFPYRKARDAYPLPHIAILREGGFIGFRDGFTGTSNSDPRGRENYSHLLPPRDEDGGVVVPNTVYPRISLGKPCPCGAGRRYRDCHANRGVPSGRRRQFRLEHEGRDLLQPWLPGLEDRD